MRIAVIGASGFLGTHLLDELIGRQCEIRVIIADRPGKARERIFPASVEKVNAQINDVNQLRRSLVDCKAIVYLSGINREIEPGDFDRVHVRDLQSVIEAANAVKIQKLVYVSFLRARPHPASNYLQSKWNGEKLLRSSSLDYTILKPGICFGTGDQMISSIVRGLELTPVIGLFATVGIKQPDMSPVYAGDIAKIITSSVLDGRLSRQTNAVVGPEKMTMSEAVKRVAKIINRKVLILPAPVSLMFAAAWILEHLSKNSLITVSQIRMLADGLSQPAEEAIPLPDDLQAKTYFTQDQIKLAVDQIR